MPGQQQFLSAAREYLYRTLPFLPAYSGEVHGSVAEQMLGCLAAYPSLAMQVHRLCADGSSNQPCSTSLLALEGTVPVEFAGARYNIPVSVRLPAGYPAVPPACYVLPSGALELKPHHAHVSSTGLCSLPSFREWGARRATLVDVVNQLVAVFSLDPPLHSRRAGTPPPPHSSQGPVTSPPPTPPQAAVPVAPPAAGREAWEPPLPTPQELQANRDAVQMQVKGVVDREAACEDAADDALQRLADSALGIDAFLKVVRTQAREQFLARALLRKLERVLAAVEAREAAQAVAEEKRQAEAQRPLPPAVPPASSASTPHLPPQMLSPPYPAMPPPLTGAPSGMYMPGLATPPVRHPEPSYPSPARPAGPYYPAVPSWTHPPPYSVRPPLPSAEAPPLGDYGPPPPNLFQTFVPPPNPYAAPGMPASGQPGPYLPNGPSYPQGGQPYAQSQVPFQAHNMYPSTAFAPWQQGPGP